MERNSPAEKAGGFAMTTGSTESTGSRSFTTFAAGPTGSGSPKSVGASSSLDSPKRNLTVSSNFIKSVEGAEEVEHHGATCAETWKVANRLLNSSFVANLMTLVILVDAFCTIVDIDARASGTQTPQVYPLLSNVCLAMYTLEVITLCIVKGTRKACGHWMVRLDVFIVLSGLTELLLQNFAAEIMFNLGFVPVLRMVRVLRLARLLKRLRAFRELQKLVRMMATCLKALFWSFVFCFMIMTVWAMLIVEFVHPIMLEKMDDMEASDIPNIAQECPQCVTSTSAVMEANLLLFKTVIAGDSWGTIAVPVIREYPATAIIFCGSLLTLVFGVLNLIVRSSGHWNMQLCASNFCLLHCRV